MKFLNNTDSISIDAAIKDAETLLQPSSNIFKDILNKNDWKYNSGNGSEIVTKLLIPKTPIDVYYYKPIYPWSAALGYFDGEAIHINYRKLLNHTALVGLLLHEYAHYCGFNHGIGPSRNYKSKDKILHSVPYWLSENAGKYLC